MQILTKKKSKEKLIALLYCKALCFTMIEWSPITSFHPQALVLTPHFSTTQRPHTSKSFSWFHRFFLCSGKRVGLPACSLYPCCGAVSSARSWLLSHQRLSVHHGLWPETSALYTVIQGSQSWLLNNTIVNLYPPCALSTSLVSGLLSSFPLDYYPGQRPDMVHVSVLLFNLVPHCSLTHC